MGKTTLDARPEDLSVLHHTEDTRDHLIESLHSRVCAGGERLKLSSKVYKDDFE